MGSVAGIAISVGGAPAFAQTPPAPASPAQAPAPGQPSPTATTELPAIDVTGAGGNQYEYKADLPTIPKFTQPLLDTPQTIDTVPRKLLDDQGNTNFRDALRNVPGISLAAGEAASQGDALNIRGFTARNDIFLDGMRDFGGYYRDPFYLEDIQVLKGPAGLIFGRGSTGGVVEQDSKLPKLDSFVSGTVALGSDLTRRATTDVNQQLPQLAEGAALRLNAMVQDGNVADRDTARNRRFGLAPSLALGLGTPTRVTLSYLHQQEYDIPDYGLPWLYTAPPGAVTGVARPLTLNSNTQNNYYGFNNGNYLRTIVDVPTLKVEHDFNNAITVSDQLRYGRYSRAFDITEPALFTAASAAGKGTAGTALLITPVTPLSSLTVSRNQLAGRSQETFLQNQLDMTAKFRTGPVEHALRTGFEVGKETSNPTRYTTTGPYSTTSLLNPTPGDAFNAGTYYASDTKTTAFTQALYALDTIKINDQLQIMGGLRWDRFDADFNQVTYPNPITGVGTGASAFSNLNYQITWRGGVVYKPLPNGSVYFDAGTSFNPSAEALSLSLATAALPPVKNRSYEVGTKWDFWDGALSTTAALFQTEQTNVREPDPNNALFNILAGNAVAKGGEVSVSGHITKEWEVNAGYAYTYSAITKSPTIGPFSDIGHRLANTPLHQINLWSEYHLPWYKIEIGGGVNVSSGRYASSTPRNVGGVAFMSYVPGFYTLSAMVKYPIDDHVSLQLNMYNLTDNKYYDQIHPSHVVPGAGRTAMFTLAYKY